jgi:hypothetical protein
MCGAGVVFMFCWFKRELGLAHDLPLPQAGAVLLERLHGMDGDVGPASAALHAAAERVVPLKVCLVVIVWRWEVA